MESGDHARIATWQVDIKRIDNDWRIASAEPLSGVENLFRLSVTPTKQFEAKNFTDMVANLSLRP